MKYKPIWMNHGTIIVCIIVPWTKRYVSVPPEKVFWFWGPAYFILESLIIKVKFRIKILCISK